MAKSLIYLMTEKKMFFKVLEFILYDSILTKNIKTYLTTPSIIFGKDKWIATFQRKGFPKKVLKTRFQNIYGINIIL